MSKHDPRVTLNQILDFILEVQAYLEGESLDSLLVQRMKLRAFERVMFCIGEAIKRLPSKLCETYPAVDWKGAAGMRDWVAHGYDGLNYEVLWNSAQQRLPELMTVVKRMLSDLGPALPPEEMPD